MINKSIIIGALARDCEQSLINNIPLIENLRSYFRYSSVVIVENDSIDDTKKILSSWQKKSHQVYINSFNENSISSQDLTLKGKQRISKMVRYRNLLIEKIRELELSDYIMLIDIDIISFSVEGILKALLNAPSDFGGLFSNGRLKVIYRNKENYVDLQYDSYAFLSSDEEMNELKTKDFSILSQLKRSQLMQKGIDNNLFFPCKSAFGGIGIYKSNLISDIAYELSYISNNSSLCFCEHIPFNNSIINKGYKNYISKQIEVVYQKNQINRIKGTLLILFPFTYNYLNLLKHKLINIVK